MDDHHIFTPSTMNRIDEVVEFFILPTIDSSVNEVPNLMSMYNDESSVIVQGRRVQGRQKIQDALEVLRRKCRRKVTAYDSQPTGNGGILISVSGDMEILGEHQVIEDMLDSLEQCCSNDSGDAQILGEHQAHKFHQVFLLMPTPEGSYYVQNDILRVKPPHEPCLKT